MDKKNSIQIVLVLYKTVLADSLSYVSLRKHLSELKVPVSILLYNNSPEIQVEATQPDEYVVNATSNTGLAEAYNCAIQLALKNHHPWLLLLDQDTELTAAYFIGLQRFFQEESAQQYAFVVPMLEQNNHHLSPLAYPVSWGPFWPKRNQAVTFANQAIYQQKCVVAYNSVSLLSVEKIQEIGGFNKDFPLDMLDYSYFYELYQQRVKFYVLEVSLQQHLSLLDTQHRMSLERYKNYLCANLQFAHKIGCLAVLSLKLRLLGVLIKQCLQESRRPYIRLTFKNICKFWSK